MRRQLELPRQAVTIPVLPHLPGYPFADMVELVDASDLKSGGLGREGSSPSIRTIVPNKGGTSSMWETWTARVNMTWDQWVASWATFWNDFVWYMHQLGTSFYATVISPRPLGVLLTPLLLVLSAIFFAWLLCRITFWVLRVFNRKQRRKAWLEIMRLRRRHFTEAQRVAYQRERMTDMIIAHIERMHHYGDFSSDECAWWYKECALKLGLPGLVPCYKEHLIKELQERRKRGEDVTIRDNRIAFLNKAQVQSQSKAETLAEIIEEKYGKEPTTLGEMLEQK